jgi:IPT/TIG domain
MAAVITSISPVSGPPGTVITVTGSGFDTTAKVGCPVLVETTDTSSVSLQATIPPDLNGPAGAQMLIGVFVQNADGSISNMVQFTVLFPAVNLQAWTSIDQVCGEIPNFIRGGSIPDSTITTWIQSISQSVSSCLLRRGLPMDPTLWWQPTPSDASPTPAAVLEQITRYGAAARLAAAISGQFAGGGEWGLQKNLDAAFAAEMKLLSQGSYDKLFQPAAATEETGQLVDTGQITTQRGGSGQAFYKEQRF